jgi:DNA repair protein RadC
MMIDQIKTILNCSYEQAGRLKDLILEEKATEYSFTAIPGIGPKKAHVLLSALELNKAIGENRKPLNRRISCSKDAADIFTFLEHYPHEEFWILLLNRTNMVKNMIRVSIGGTGGTVTDVKLIAKHAIDNRCDAMIVCHNHPSGNLTPSDADKKITRKIKEALTLLEVSLLDHVIVSSKGYLSFADDCLL